MAGAPFDEPTQQERDALIAKFEALFGQALPPGIRNQIQNAPNFIGIGNVMTAFLQAAKKAPPGGGNPN